MMRKYGIAAFLILVGLYALFQARNLILGPRLAIDVPANNSSVEAGALEVRGTAKNISSLTLDGNPIYIDTAGRWQEELIAFRGLNIIKLSGKDRFGREKDLLVQIFAN